MFYKEKLLTRSIFLLIYTSKNNITTFFLMLYDMNFTRSSKDYPDPDWFMGKHCGFEFKTCHVYLTHPGVAIDEEEHHGELQPEQEVEVAPALGHGAGLSRGHLLHWPPSSAGPSSSSSLNHLQYSEGIITQCLYHHPLVVSLRRGSLLGTGQAWLMCWLVRTEAPSTIAHQQRFLVRTPHQAAHRGMGQHGAYTLSM